VNAPIPGAGLGFLDGLRPRPGTNVPAPTVRELHVVELRPGPEILVAAVGIATAVDIDLSANDSHVQSLL